MGHCEFCFLDRDRSRRHFDFSRTLFAQAKMENFHQPSLRSHDRICGFVCWNFSAISCRTRLVCLVAFPATQFQRHLATISKSLEWDVFAVSTYATVSILFWYMGMIPDLAVIRDRAKETWRKYFGVLSMGWRNANNHWRNFEMAYLLLAGLSTPLVLSVHTIVSFDLPWPTSVGTPRFSLLTL